GCGVLEPVVPGEHVRVLYRRHAAEHLRELSGGDLARAACPVGEQREADVQHRKVPYRAVAEDVRDQVRKLLVTGDNRLKGGRTVAIYARARESFEQALARAEQHGIADERLRTIIGRRIDDTRALERELGGT